MAKAPFGLLDADGSVQQQFGKPDWKLDYEQDSDREREITGRLKGAGLDVD